MKTELECRVISDYATVRDAYFPQHINAITLPNDDGTFDIYVNISLPRCKQLAALNHELNHIEQNHFYKCEELRQIEAEAELLIVTA